MPDIRYSSALHLIGALALAVMLCLAWPAWAEDEDTILWLFPDFPPVYITEGPQAGTGVGDKVLRYFVERLPGYRHEKGVSNFKRIIATLAAGRKACGITLLKNEERAKVVEYSDSFMVSPQNEIVTVKRHLPKFEPFMDGEGAVSLAELLDAAPATLGYSLGRSYSSPIDAVIRARANVGNSVSTSGTDIFEGLMRMLKFDRIHYTIGYGYEGRYIADKLGFGSEVVAVPVREHLGYTRVYAGCPKSDWGRKVVAELNVLIETAVRDRRVYGIYQEWLDPQSWRRYEKAMARMYWDSGTPAK